MVVTLRTQQLNGESAIYIGPATLVASRSKPDAWYVVEHGRCTCAGYTYRGTCRHLAAARAAEELERASAQPVGAPEPTEEVVFTKLDLPRWARV